MNEHRIKARHADRAHLSGEQGQGGRGGGRDPSPSAAEGPRRGWGGHPGWPWWGRWQRGDALGGGHPRMGGRGGHPRSIVPRGTRGAGGATAAWPAAPAHVTLRDQRGSGCRQGPPAGASSGATAGPAQPAPPDPLGPPAAMGAAGPLPPCRGRAPSSGFWCRCWAHGRDLQPSQCPPAPCNAGVGRGTVLGGLGALPGPLSGLCQGRGTRGSRLAQCRAGCRCPAGGRPVPWGPAGWRGALGSRGRGIDGPRRVTAVINPGEAAGPRRPEVN